MKDILESIRTTIADMSRRRRWLFAFCATLAHIVIVTFVTSETNPFPTIAALVAYAMLIMFLTGTWNKVHVWVPGIALLMCVYPFLATLAVAICELVSTNIAMRCVRPNPEPEANADAGVVTTTKQQRRKRKKRRKQARDSRRHS